MVKKYRLGFVLVTALGFAVAHPARGQDLAAEAQNKLLAKRAAEADCYRKLAETVYGLQISSDTYVRDFVTESDVIHSHVDEFVKGIKLGPPRYYDDGTCEVDGEVTVAKLVTKLKQIHAEHYKGRSVKTTDFEQITKTVKRDVIRATGSGAPRPELPPDLPEGVEAVLTPLPPGSIPVTTYLPAIWKTVPAQGRLMAERAAQIDAVRKLLERIKGLRLTSETLVRDFVTESDEISARAQGLVAGASRVGRPYLHDDELIVEVTMEIPVEKVVTKVKEFHSEHYRGNRVTTTDITNVKKIQKRATIQATGTGVPPAKFLQKASSAGHTVPEWFTIRLMATGQATDPAINTAQGKLKAARAAELVALRKLAEQIYGLQISSDTTVRDFVTEYDEISSQVQAVVTEAIAQPPRFHDDIAEVTVSLPAAEVWTVVHQHTLIIKRKG